ncbi:MAG TPA: hypothetical protein VMZ53_20470 [Kofleriaceae bacterium]|nr:hypothetical protein [Kofleriaceae bacterium]
MSRLQDLDAYLTREMSDADADALEEAMFDAPDDADLAFFDRLMRHGRRLVEHGTFEMGVLQSKIDELITKGHTVQVLDAGPAGQPQQTLVLSRDAEFIVTKLHLGRTDIARVDVEITIVEHDVTKTIKDVLVDPSDGIIYGLCERPLAHLALGAGAAHTKVRRVDGARDVLGEWHTVGQLAV